MPSGDRRGRFVWHELMTNDVPSALKFYTKVVGWKAAPYPDDPSYTLLSGKGPNAQAGVMTMPPDAKAMGAAPHWLNYIGSPDVDSSVARATEFGATVLVPPQDIPKIGRFTVLKDPFGATFAIFTPTGEGMGGGSRELGEFSWHELITPDPSGAFEFYSRLFGWENAGNMDMGPMGNYQMFGLDGGQMGGIYRQPADMPGPPSWLPYVLVPDTKRASQLIAAAGGRVINGPMEVPGGDWIVAGIDPEGVMFALHSRKPAEKKPAEKKPAARKPAAKKPKAKKPAKKKAAKKPAKKTAKKKAARKAPRRKVAARKQARPARRKVARRRSAKKKK